MQAEAHLKSLTVKHRALDDRIAAEILHPSADDTKVRELKREKLKLKEQIERIKAGG